MLNSASERPGSAARGVVGGQFESCQPTTPRAVATSIEPLLSVRDLTRLLSCSRPFARADARGGSTPAPGFYAWQIAKMESFDDPQLDRVWGWQMSSPTSRLRQRPDQAIRRDPGKVTAYDQAQAALEIALYQHNFGTADTLAWIAAGAPDNGASQADNDLYQTARSVVSSNSCSVKAVDPELILALVIRRHRLSRKEGQA